MVDITRLVIDGNQMSGTMFIEILSVLPNVIIIRIISLPLMMDLFMSDKHSQILTLFLNSNKITKFFLQGISRTDDIFLAISLFPRVRFIALQIVGDFSLELTIEFTLKKLNNDSIRHRHPMTLCVIASQATNDKAQKLTKMINSKKLLENYILYRQLDKFFIEWT